MFNFWSKGHDSRAIANQLVAKFRAAQVPLDVPRLQRYVYLAHAWTLGYNKKPLLIIRSSSGLMGPVSRKFRRRLGRNMTK